MGCIAFVAGAISFLISMALGIFGFNLHAKALREHGQGSRKLYWMIACAVAIGFVAAAFAVGSRTSLRDEYTPAIHAFILICAAPGAGLLAGALASLKRP